MRKLKAYLVTRQADQAQIEDTQIALDGRQKHLVGEDTLADIEEEKGKSQCLGSRKSGQKVKKPKAYFAIRPTDLTHDET